MEYQKITNFLDNTPNQPTRFETKNWVEVNEDSRGTYNTNSQTKIKMSMLKSSLCDYSDVYMLVTGTITVPSTRKNIIIKNCAPFTDCMSKINNTQIDNAKYIDMIMPMYNLIQHSDNYSKTSGRLWQYYRDEPF